MIEAESFRSTQKQKYENICMYNPLLSRNLCRDILKLPACSIVVECG